MSAWLDGELAPGPASQPFELSWPLDDEALEDLRWYLEDYLRAPFGVYGDRGPKVATRLEQWGEAIFGALFGAGPARDAYVRYGRGRVPRWCCGPPPRPFSGFPGSCWPTPPGPRPSPST